jgi:UDP-N-acetylmuramate--alanine ligase
MENLDLTKIKKIFFIGVGGIGISAVARMMLQEGKNVSGSDISENEITRELQNLGVQITLGQTMELIPKDVDLVICSIAIPKYDPEFFKKLQSSNIQILSYPQMLGVVTENKYTIAIAGTHGKTTTTAMIAKILIDAKRDPSVIVGSLLKDYKSNFIAGQSEFFVVEACEYERSFLNLKPKILVITNIEPEHLDYYKDLADIQNAFNQLIMQSEYIISDYRKYLEKVPKLLVPGIHNRMNAAAALAVAEILNIDEKIAKKSLQEFSGTWRRLEKRGETKEGTIIYDDYAHHPTEIRASLQALRELYPVGKKKITVLFQPHLYSRTKALFGDFAKSFQEADRVLLLPIYFAREAKDESISSEKLAQAITLAGKNAQAFSSFELAENFVKSLNLDPEDIFVTMGAGEAYKVADRVFFDR